MKIIKNLFTKNEELSLEDRDKINTIINNKNTTYEDTNNIDLRDFVSHLNLEQLNELRELIDKREDELHKLYGLKDEKPTTKKEYKGEIDIKEPVHEEDLNNKTYDDNKNYKEQVEEINDSVTEEITDIHEKQNESKKINQTEFDNEDDEYIELDEEITIEENNTIEEHENTNLKTNINDTQNDIYLKIIKIFGEENVFKETKKNFNAKLPKDKDILCIGIRKSDAFNKDSESIQNTWFIQNIKQLDELAHFKMVTSMPNQKELFWDKEINPILISYKSTNILKTKDEFEF